MSASPPSTIGKPRAAPESDFYPRLHLIAGLVYPFWYGLTPDGARDAWWTWGAVGLVFLVSGMLSYRIPTLRALLVNMFPGPWLSTLHMYTLAWLNDMQIFYTIGSVVAVLSFCIAVASSRGLAWYGAFAAALGAGLFALDPDALKVACWLGVLPVIAIAHQRLSIVEERRQIAEEYRSELVREIEDRTRELSEANRTLASEMEERARLEKELRIASKLEAVGRLAGGMAHEFNNLLTRIRIYSELAMDVASRESSIGGDIAEIQRASDQAAELTRQLLTLSRRGGTSSERIELNETIASCQSILKHLLGESRKLVLRPAPAPLAIFADPREIEQVLVNLALNARDAMPDGGRVTIATSGEMPPDLPHREVESDASHEYVCLTFSDTGIGMDAETRERVFDPFFTKKETGTGLGLSVVYGILAQSDGLVRVDSQPGAGACFALYWPRASQLSAPPSPPAPAHGSRGGSERILLVEDEEQVRTGLARLLRSHGYRVVSSESGERALLEAAGTHEPFALLLSDVVMPGMSGVELADEIGSRHPKTKVLLTSGRLETPGGLHADVPDRYTFLAKPFDAQDLLGRIREILDG